jgi:5-formyltetrahydrofolate cyclo-ligase
MLSDPQAKQYLRKLMLSKRQLLTDAEKSRAADAIMEPLLACIPASAVVAGYWPVKGELDIIPLLLEFSKRGHALCLPVVEHKESPLIFHAWHPDQALVKGSYGIEVPKDSKPVIPDLVLVPLVAFDDEGYRIGYGAGYYDQTIRDLRVSKKNVTFIGVGYDFQRVEKVPAEPFDERLDKVISVP